MNESRDKEETKQSEIDSTHENSKRTHEVSSRVPETSNEARQDSSEMREVASRRAFLKGTAGGLLATALTANARASSDSNSVLPSPQQNINSRSDANSDTRSFIDTPLAPVAALPSNVTRVWLGSSFWANRLQDWRLHDGRIECLAGAAGNEVRSVAVLTREITRGLAAASLSVRAGLLEDAGGGGFCGFLIGAGDPATLDYRAAALAQKASGENGGLLCTYETDGRGRFREHTSESNALAFNELPVDDVTHAAGAPVNSVSKEVTLDLGITPQSDGRFTLRLTARDTASGAIVSSAARRNVAEQDITGGISLVSSPATGKAGARYWFRDLRTGGAKIAEHPERALGPVIGTLYSLNGNVLKLSAQLMPVGDTESQNVKLQIRAASGNASGSAEAWRDAGSAHLEGGWTALFRLPNWDSSRDWEYRVVYGTDATQTSGESYYAGRIRRDPVNKESLTVGLINCVAASYRSLEGGANRAELPKAEPLGRYTHKSLYFPHRELVQNAGYHDADLLVFPGDQFYESSPTHPENKVAPVLDYLYKWYLWIWSFRDLTRNAPAILLVDDHDMYQGNIWGNGGRVAPEHDQNRGGYVCRPDWVNMVQRTQCSHNPDAYDPTPIDQGITVYYGAFRYGGVSFAVVEDRKFKTAPLQGTDLDVHEASLLGERQEKFLEAWARDRRDGEPKICLTQTLWACVQTTPGGQPMLDFDSNGYPKYNRDRAIRLLREANALLLAGDQHLASVVRHGVDGNADGIVQFTGPAGGTSWTRWFEPAKTLPNAREGVPHTGDFEDAFGNRVRVLAVANPPLTFAEYRQYNKGRGQGLGDRKLKSDGYAVVRVNKRTQEFVLECWPWNADMRAGGARQYHGWPVRVSFAEVGGSKLNAGD